MLKTRLALDTEPLHVSQFKDQSHYSSLLQFELKECSEIEQTKNQGERRLKCATARGQPASSCTHCHVSYLLGYQDDDLNICVLV